VEQVGTLAYRLTGADLQLLMAVLLATTCESPVVGAGWCSLAGQRWVNGEDIGYRGSHREVATRRAS